MENNIKFIGYLNKKADYKPQCHRCGYSSHVWSIDDEWICKDCLTYDEMELLVNYIEEVLVGDFCD